MKIADNCPIGKKTFQVGADNCPIGKKTFQVGDDAYISFRSECAHLLET